MLDQKEAFPFTTTFIVQRKCRKGEKTNYYHHMLSSNFPSRSETSYAQVKYVFSSVKLVVIMSTTLNYLFVSGV